MISQILLNALIAGSVYALVGIGFSLIYGQTRFFHFAHGAVFASGAYAVFFFMEVCRIPFPASVALAIAFTAGLGILLDLCFYRRLRRKGASAIILLLVSLGVYVAFENLISMCFGDQAKSIRLGAVYEGINVLGGRITLIQMAMISTSILLVVILAWLQGKTRIGRVMRAVACDPVLAAVSGIESDRVILWTFALGSALAGGAGILVALDVDVRPTMGMNPLMMGVVAVIIGGVGRISGVALGALLLGLAQHLGVWKIGSQWQDAIAFVILLVFLLFRPQGFFGKKEKKARV
jgi:branched-chain amino acid transport system permease protein